MLPETSAAERIADIVEGYLEPRWLTADCLRAVSMKIVANRAAIAGVFAELDQDPARLRPSRVQLRQQRVQELTDAEWWDEHIHLLQTELEDARAIRERIARFPEHDPDEAGAREDDARLSRERADEAANVDAVRP